MIHAAEGQRFELLSGFTLEGTPIAANNEGVVVKRPDGSLAQRVHWTNFTQTALKKLMENKDAKPFAEEWIEEDVRDEPIPQDPKVTVKEVTRLVRPSAHTGWGALFTTPVSLLVCVLVYLANLYAGYEIARYRNYHPVMVCGMAAVAPIVGPLIFICLPTYYEEPVVEAEEEEAAPQEPIALQSRASSKEAEEEAPAAAKPGGPAPPTIYKRPQVTFNRRFFETKLAAFMKVVPSEAERDMVICVVSARGNYVGTRLTRILPNGLTLQVKKGDASNDVDIQFSEITEVQIRHKDAAG